MTRACVAAVWAVLVSISVTGQTKSPAATRVTVIRAGMLVDVEAGTATPNQTIVVDDGTITAVGTNVAVPAGAALIDLSSSTVLPGLFDAHTHLCMDILPRDAGDYFLTTLRDPDTDRAIQGVVNARTMVEAGFTTVRDVGNEGRYACTSLRRAVERQVIVGPTIVNAGRIIAPYGGQFRLQPDRPDLGEPEYFFADSRDEMRKAVRQNIHYGARVIKIVVDDQRYIFSEDDIRFMVAEAAQAGLKVAAHVSSRQGAHNAAAASVASLEHLNEISDDDLALAKQKGVVAVFTPMPVVVLQQIGMSEADAKSTYATEIDRLRAGHRIGVPIAFGSDAALALPELTRGATTMQWIDSYVDADLRPADILRAMTSSAARLLGFEKERGAIRPQMAADIIATTGNPLVDIRALKRVSFVMKNGRIVKR